MSMFVSTLTVFSILFAVGFGISMLDTYVHCSKVSAVSSVYYGAIWSLLPGIAYVSSRYFDAVRLPFSSGVQEIHGWFSPTSPMTQELSSLVGTGYLMMISSWIMTTYLIGAVESDVCKPNVDEMNKVQEELLKQLKQKQDEKNANEKKPITLSNE